LSTEGIRDALGYGRCALSNGGAPAAVTLGLYRQSPSVTSPVDEGLPISSLGV
jgi:hypothetical protein